jgi:hypothetical protein
MNRFATTLASQLAVTIPATAQFIDAAITVQPGLLTGDLSLGTQMDLLILFPFLAVVEEGAVEVTLNKPFLLVIDGLDECEDKRGVKEFIRHIQNFFREHPDVPLKVFIASRADQHIQELLETDTGVWLGNLNSHWQGKDIERFLEYSFQDAAEQNRVVRTYIQAQGEWPSRSDMKMLIKHIGGSFVLASAIFKFIIQPTTDRDPLTPMARLPLALKMNVLDGLYSKTLARSQHLPHFHDIISALALLWKSLPVAGIAGLLGINPYEVVHVLLNLQAIIHIPKQDEEGTVTLCHTSLSEFLNTESRSGSFFVPPSFNLYLSYCCFSCLLEHPDRSDPPHDYASQCCHFHWLMFAQSDTCNFVSEIEKLKTRQPPRDDGFLYHAFLCTLLFYSLLYLNEPLTLQNTARLQVLTECSKHLALAMESSNSESLIKPWLETRFHHSYPFNGGRKVRFVEHMYKAAQDDLRRGSTIAAQMVGIL